MGSVEDIIVFCDTWFSLLLGTYKTELLSPLLLAGAMIVLAHRLPVEGCAAARPEGDGPAAVLVV